MTEGENGIKQTMERGTDLWWDKVYSAAVLERAGVHLPEYEGYNAFCNAMYMRTRSELAYLEGNSAESNRLRDWAKEIMVSRGLEEPVGVARLMSDPAVDGEIHG